MTEEKNVLNQYPRGNNVLKEPKPKTSFELFMEQLNEPLILILVAAAAISMLLREFADTAIILTVIIVDAVVGMIQERKAQKALCTLKELTIPYAWIERDGEPVKIAAKDLIVGDKVLLSAGCQVPADLRLVEVNNLKIEEAALTGESIPVEKNTGKANRAFMSTNVTYGRGKGIVIAIGMDTEIGRIANIMNNTQAESTPLQKKLAKLGKILSVVAIAICVLLFFIAIRQHRDVMEMLVMAISIAVAAVPEGLPAVVTIVLAISVSRLVKVNTIVKHLPSVETLGCVSVVCSDKTGTLTQNKMTVTKCYSNGRMVPPEQLKMHKDQHLLECMTLCNDAVLLPNKRVGDPTELALLDLARCHGLHRSELEQNMPRKEERSFDANRKMMTTLHQKAGKYISYTKGATQKILQNCTHVMLDGDVKVLTDVRLQEIEQEMRVLSSQSLRLLAFGMRHDIGSLCENNLIFIGFVGMMDPVRPEAKEAVQTFRDAGVTPIMITGDRSDTAFSIAKELNIAYDPKECISGTELGRLSEKEFTLRLSYLRVFAQVSPEHKVRIVNALKNSGEIVAMTGDGVNDAPSLKAADVGIAMGQNGTDVARNAADIVLIDDNFATIGKAIAQGRSIYENIKKAILFLISSNLGEIIVMMLAIIAGLKAPLKPSHILWVNLITDSLPALALGIDANSNKNLMKRKPRGGNESLFSGGGTGLTIFYGILIAGITLIAFLQLPLRVILDNGLPVTVFNFQGVLEDPVLLRRAQTYAFIVLGLSELFHAVGMKNVERSFFRTNPWSNKLMIIAVFCGFLLQIAVTRVPYLVDIFGTARLSIEEWIMLTVLSAMPLFAHELFVLSTIITEKRLFRRRPVKVQNTL